MIESGLGDGNSRIMRLVRKASSKIQNSLDGISKPRYSIVRFEDESFGSDSNWNDKDLKASSNLSVDANECSSAFVISQISELDDVGDLRIPGYVREDMKIQ